MAMLGLQERMEIKEHPDHVAMQELQEPKEHQDLPDLQDHKDKPDSLELQDNQEQQDSLVQVGPLVLRVQQDKQGLVGRLGSLEYLELQVLLEPKELLELPEPLDQQVSLGLVAPRDLREPLVAMDQMELWETQVNLVKQDQPVKRVHQEQLGRVDSRVEQEGLDPGVSRDLLDLLARQDSQDQQGPREHPGLEAQMGQ